MRSAGRCGAISRRCRSRSMRCLVPGILGTPRRGHGGRLRGWSGKRELQFASGVAQPLSLNSQGVACPPPATPKGAREPGRAQTHKNERGRWGISPSGPSLTWSQRPEVPPKGSVDRAIFAGKEGPFATCRGRGCFDVCKNRRYDVAQRRVSRMDLTDLTAEP